MFASFSQTFFSPFFFDNALVRRGTRISCEVKKTNKNLYYLLFIVKSYCNTTGNEYTDDKLPSPRDNIIIMSCFKFIPSIYTIYTRILDTLKNDTNGHKLIL